MEQQTALFNNNGKVKIRRHSRKHGDMTDFLELLKELRFNKGKPNVTHLCKKYHIGKFSLKQLPEGFWGCGYQDLTIDYARQIWAKLAHYTKMQKQQSKQLKAEKTTPTLDIESRVREIRDDIATLTQVWGTLATDINGLFEIINN